MCRILLLLCPISPKLHSGVDFISFFSSLILLKFRNNVCARVCVCVVLKIHSRFFSSSFCFLFHIFIPPFLLLYTLYNIHCYAYTSHLHRHVLFLIYFFFCSQKKTYKELKKKITKKLDEREKQALVFSIKFFFQFSLRNSIIDVKTMTTTTTTACRGTAISLSLNENCVFCVVEIKNCIGGKKITENCVCVCVARHCTWRVRQ